MNKFNIGGFKLPHMSNSALPVKKYGEAKEPEINRNFPRLENKVPIPIKQTVSSSGGLTPDERAKATQLLDSTKNTYMNREYKRTGRYDPEQRKVVFENVPMSDEENLAEWNREKGSYYVDFDKDGNAKVLNVPRGDDDIPVQSFLKGLDPSQYRGEFFSDLPEDYQDPGLIKGHPLNPNEGYQRVDNFRN